MQLLRRAPNRWTGLSMTPTGIGEDRRTALKCAIRLIVEALDILDGSPNGVAHLDLARQNLCDDLRDATSHWRGQA